MHISTALKAMSLLIGFLWSTSLFSGPPSSWPAYRGDALRSGYAAQPLASSLSLQWTYKAVHPPMPAWRGPDTRMPFDRAFQPVGGDGRVFFGSSADCKLYALNLKTGQILWTFFTDGPVRFAPTLWQDKLFAVSDDGMLYCLSTEDGKVIWSHRGGPRQDMLLGNDRMISRWPARGGAVVRDDTVYYAAGIWPSEGIYLYALEAGSGKCIWKNDTAGGMRMPQPHGGAVAESGISAQGYLAADETRLYVPTGRGVPAVFDRATGKFLYFHLQANGALGGADIMVNNAHLFNGGAVFDAETGARNRHITGLPRYAAVSLPGGLSAWRSGAVMHYQWGTKTLKDRKGNPYQIRALTQSWKAQVPYGGSAMIAAGKAIVSAGAGKQGEGICIISTDTRQITFSKKVSARPLGLAAVDGCLLVSTDKGMLYCFGPGEEEKAIIAAKKDKPSISKPCLAAAEEIIRETGVTEGYCFDLGCGDGGLALALAQRTNFHIMGIEKNPALVAAARKRLDAAGLYGVRVTIHQGDPAATDYPDYFADLIVSGRSALPSFKGEAFKTLPAPEIQRLLRPSGGVSCFGPPGNMVKQVRGPMKGAGTWTHQYCDTANTNCSSDTHVQGPLAMLWFRDTDFWMPNRHGRAPAPLFLDGRIYIEGENALRCQNAYNGRPLWEYPLPGILKTLDQDHLMGTAGTGSNMCITPEALHVHTGPQCLRLDPADGRLLGTIQAPKQPDGKPGTWGIIACDGDTLFGTLADTTHIVKWRYLKGDMSRQYTESILFFAMDARSGRIRWRYTPTHSIRNNAIAIGKNCVYLMDRPIAEMDRLVIKDKTKAAAKTHPTGKLLALNIKDGSPAWHADKDIYGTTLSLSEKHDVLVMSYQDTRFKLASEAGGRMAAFQASTGKPLWDIKASYGSRIIINDRTIYAQPGAWDLLTGKHDPDFRFERSYGCGTLAGAPRMLLFRSATLGYRDLVNDRGTQNYGGIRPGCWINVIPAGGLVLMPDATSRCRCSYLMNATIALKPFTAEQSQP